MDTPIPAGQDNEEPLKDGEAEASDRDDESPRRAFLKAGLKGALLLPYVAPLIESIHLSDADADDGDDDDDNDNDERPTGLPPSQIANLPPPPPGNTNSSNTNS